jgi:hypothetical protein
VRHAIVLVAWLAALKAFSLLGKRGGGAKIPNLKLYQPN